MRLALSLSLLCSEGFQSRPDQEETERPEDLSQHDELESEILLLL